MAISSTVVWEVRDSGNAGNGGGFNTAAAGTDYSQQDNEQVYIDNTNITCTTPNGFSNTLTFTKGYTPSADDVGNIVRIYGGNSINYGYYEITGYTGTTWTVSGATVLGGPATNVVGKMGGASSAVGYIASSVVDKNKVWITGDFDVTMYFYFAGKNVVAEGYGTSRGDGVRATTTTVDFSDYAAQTQNLGRATIKNFDFYNIDIIGAYIENSTQCVFVNCKFRADGGSALVTSNSTATFINCEFILDNEYGDTLISLYEGEYKFYNCTFTTRVMDYPLIYGDLSSSLKLNFDGCVFSTGDCAFEASTKTMKTYSITMTNCSLFNLGSAGITFGNYTTTADILLNNNIFDSIGGYILYSGSAFSTLSLNAFNNALYNIDESDLVNSNVPTKFANSINLSSSPFVDANNENFSLNDNASGRLCKDAGLCINNNNSTRDVGAMQAVRKAVAPPILKPIMSTPVPVY